MIFFREVGSTTSPRHLNRSQRRAKGEPHCLWGDTGGGVGGPDEVFRPSAGLLSALRPGPPRRPRTSEPFRVPAEKETEGEWIRTLDPATGHFYLYNPKSRESKWETRVSKTDEQPKREENKTEAAGDADDYDAFMATMRELGAT